jgi:hypothetical protein
MTDSIRSWNPAQGARVSLFGTGNFGQIVLRCLEKRGVEVEKVFDTNASNWGNTFCGVLVSKPEDMVSSDVVLIASNISDREYIRGLCLASGVSALDVDEVLREVSLEALYPFLDIEWPPDRAQEVVDLYLFDIESERDSTGLRVKSLDVVLTEKCSLKCENCSNLMQYYEDPKNADLEEMLVSISNFMASVDFVYELRVIGGEPFMFKDIESVLRRILSFSNFEKCVIYTNGTILPRGEALTLLGDSRVWIKISDYGSLSRNAARLVHLANEQGINCISERITEWEDCGRVVSRNRSNAQNERVFATCCVSDTLTLLHGLLYSCPFAAHADNLHAIADAPEDRVDMTKNEGLRGGIDHLYRGKTRLVACGSCNGRDHNVSKVPAATQTRYFIPLDVVAR